MNYDRKNKAILYHADISKRYFSVCHLKIVCYFLHQLNQRSRSSDVNGRHQRPVDSDITEGVLTTRGNRMKFRLFLSPILPKMKRWKKIPFFDQNHGLTPLRKANFTIFLLLFFLYSLERRFFFLEYRQRLLPCLFCLK